MKGLAVMKALRISVYKNPSYKGCSNGGITERYDELLLVCDEGYIDIDENNPPENLVVFVDRTMGGVKCGYIKPYAPCPKGCVGWMAGGSFAESCDSRFSSLVGFYGAVAVHDRTETQEQYDAMFN